MIDNDLNEVRIIEKNLNKKLEQKLKEAQKQQDILLYFLYLIQNKLPLLHFLSNIVLMIWLSQTVLSSNLKQVPRSLYLLSPLFSKQPFQNLQPSTDGRCPSNYQTVQLGSLPSIQRPKLAHQNVTHWKDSTVILCAERMKFAMPVHSGDACPANYSKCSGYCVSPVHSCPVTGIRMVRRIQDKHAYENLFYESTNPKFYMVLSRLDGKPIIDLMTFINETCANQYYFNYEFPALKDFREQVARGCEAEGNLDDITQQIDSQPFKELLKANGYIYSDEAVQKFHENLTTKLCYVQKLKFHQDNPYCKAIMSKAFTLPSLLPLTPILPQSKLLLITGLIYIIFSLVWWITYTCKLNRFRKQAAIILSAIELMHFIIIKSKYSRYLAINGLDEIQNCVKNNLQALRHWEYGISNPYIFKVVVFENTVFLSFEVLCFIVLRVLYHQV